MAGMGVRPPGVPCSALGVGVGSVRRRDAEARGGECWPGPPMLSREGCPPVAGGGGGGCLRLS